MPSRTPARADWHYVKEKLLDAYGILSEEDLEIRPGHEAVLYDRLQRKLGKSREEVKRLIESFNPDLPI